MPHIHNKKESMSEVISEIATGTADKIDIHSL